MKIEKAISQIRKHKIGRLKRRNWRPETAISLEDGYNDFNVLIKDLLANDWEVIA